MNCQITADCCQVEVFNRIIDYAIVQITIRFKSLRDTDHVFTCLKPTTITETNDDELLMMSKGLIREYSNYISDELSDQLLLLKMTFSVTLSSLGDRQIIIILTFLGAQGMLGRLGKVCLRALLT